MARSRQGPRARTLPASASPRPPAPRPDGCRRSAQSLLQAQELPCIAASARCHRGPAKERRREPGCYLEEG
eukprot:328734-Rhodomonas_salina.1